MNKRSDDLEQLDIFVMGCSETRGDGSVPKDMFKSYYGFVTDALALIQNCFTEKEQQFYATIVEAREQELTPVLSKIYMDALSNYREYEHGLKWGFEIINERDAVTNLFSYALAARIRLVNSEDIRCVWREIEGFASVYFQFFGHAKELVEIFHTNIEAG